MLAWRRCEAIFMRSTTSTAGPRTSTGLPLKRSGCVRRPLRNGRGGRSNAQACSPQFRHLRSGLRASALELLPGARGG
jgi:hypothetical protein